MGMKQYTVRSVPERIDCELRRRAREERKSLNTVVLEALEKAIGLQREPTEHSDLDFLIGSWQDDPTFDSAVAEFGKTDEGMWQ